MVALSHASHLTFEPIILFQLLDLFPDESGQKNKKSRVIPFLPGTIKFDTINLIVFFTAVIYVKSAVVLTSVQGCLVEH